MSTPILQTGRFSRCELNVLVDMYLEGQEESYIAEVLCRDVNDVKQQIKFKGLEGVRTIQQNEKKLKDIVEKHCGEKA
ncbi:hypothetical protein [Acinetobacter venetianus]|uniref:hypothetical protein n=1 Tax=Acinetobacter venetianus TaxID=52133 RepID=UPI003A92B34D